MRAVQKLDAMRADMISVNPVLAPQFMEIVTGQRAELDTTTIGAHAASVGQSIGLMQSSEKNFKSKRTA